MHHGLPAGVLTYQGKYRHLLSGYEFLDAVGQRARAQELRRRNRAATGMGIPATLLTMTGLASTIIGTIFWAMGTGQACRLELAPPSAGGIYQQICSPTGTDTGETLTFVGVGALATGIGLGIGAAVMRPHFPSDEETREFADSYNQSLRTVQLRF